MKWLPILLFAPLAFAQQAVLVSVNPANAAESPIPAAGFNWGPVAAGDTVEVRFHARNLSNAALTVTNITVGGPNAINFNEAVHTSSTPYVIPPGGNAASVMAIFVDFSGTAISTYNATLSVTYVDSASVSTTLTVNLLASVVPAPILTLGPPCTGPDANRNINFGRILQGTKAICPLFVSNPPNTGDLQLSLTGTGFTSSFGGALTVNSGLSASASLTFNPPTPSAFTGTLTVGTRTYTLSGVGFSQALPTPLWTFDKNVFSSNEQHTLAIALSGPSTVAASGTITMTFTPSVASVSRDTAIDFVATSQTVASFTVAAGATTLLLNGQPSIVFGTGTTAGTLVFTINPGAFGLASDPTHTITLAPAPITLIASSATSRANDLDVVITAFDNTYTAGPMSFIFFDRTGTQLGAAITADFSPNFRAYYQAQSGGSAFLMRVSFPVTGNATLIGSVQATFNNAAGAARTGALNFP